MSLLIYSKNDILSADKTNDNFKISYLAKEINLNSMYLGQAFKQFYKTDIKSYQQQLHIPSYNNDDDPNLLHSNFVEVN